MSGVKDIFLGETTDPYVEPRSTLTGEQEEALNQLSQLLQGQLGEGIGSYQGVTTAPASDLQSQSWRAINQLLTDSGGSTGSDEAISRILGGTSTLPETVAPTQYDVGEFDKTAIQDWYQNALVQPAMQAWQEDVVPTINESFIGQNAASSGAAPRAITESAENLMTGLNSELANALYNEKQAYDTRKYESGMDYVNKLFGADTLSSEQQFAAGQSDLDRILNVPSMESTDLGNLLNVISAGTSAGATQRDITSEGLTEDYQKWLTEQPYNNPWMQYLSTLLGTGATENIVYPGSQSEGLFQSVIAPIIGQWAGSESGFGTISGWFGG